MMNKKRIIQTLLVLATALPVCAQESVHRWTLRECIEYARENNIQVQNSRISEKSGEVDLSQARAQLFPDLLFSSNQGWSHQKTEQQNGDFKSQSAYSGSYNVSSSMTLFNGLRLRRSVELQKTNRKTLEYNVALAMDDIELSVTEAFLQIIYATEALKTNREILETSERQVERIRALYEAGSAAISDVAQLEAQYSNDSYRIVQSENALEMAKIQLKQLLELELEEQLELCLPELDEEMVLQPVPSVEQVYRIALSERPEMKGSELNVEASELSEKIAAADRLPSLSLSASVATSTNTRSDYSWGKQLNNGLNESVGVGISIPISRNRQVKSAIEKAKLQTESARLEVINTRKNLLRTIESLYQDAIAAQSRYVAASNSVTSSTRSYELVQAQFNAGMRNTVELLTEKNNYLSALQEQIEAKYQAVISLKLLNFYQGESIRL